MKHEMNPPILAYFTVTPKDELDPVQLHYSLPINNRILALKLTQGTKQYFIVTPKAVIPVPERCTLQITLKGGLLELRRKRIQVHGCITSEQVSALMKEILPSITIESIDETLVIYKYKANIDL